MRSLYYLSVGSTSYSDLRVHAYWLCSECFGRCIYALFVCFALEHVGVFHTSHLLVFSSEFFVPGHSCPLPQTRHWTVPFKSLKAPLSCALNQPGNQFDRSTKFRVPATCCTSIMPVSLWPKMYSMPFARRCHAPAPPSPRKCTCIVYFLQGGLQGCSDIAYIQATANTICGP